MASSSDDDLFDDQRIREIEDCIQFFGKEEAARICKISIKVIDELVYGIVDSTKNSSDHSNDKKSDVSKEKRQSPKIKSIVQQCSIPQSSIPQSSNQQCSIQKTNEASPDIIISDSEEEKENDSIQNNIIANDSDRNVINSHFDQLARTDSDLGNDFIWNSFITLLRIKKTFIGTDNLVSVIICNLTSTAQDIFLYPNSNKSSRFLNERSLNKSCINITMYLAVASTGSKFKPAFQLNYVQNNRPLFRNDDVEQVQDRNEWLDIVFKQEIEKNMIYNCVCISDNDIFFHDQDSRAKLSQLNCELIVSPNILAPQISPFHRSILLTLNGILHRFYLNSKRFPNTIDQSVRLFSDAWQQLSENDIKNSFRAFLDN